ncbi:NAD(P)/FAD-dependent oxidoreductase [Frankia sp. AgKG'84/4]|uniref:NAD(P)/FAD-dependent oxidoreductase n=1 Tax=Frankia sp. AgKG'84/4 TaxID=573490 RepID=UPI00200E9D43|nr:NAD(P)/FAD-dependent oxidoreductase [Frankia sp. AgKG'84/4]MCL9795232.1 NAD(P)/FAD-dependent oxidoreductase [Frankia sp. AgKG'84/4]
MTDVPPSFDVIVVGARCAGSPLAMLLARRGHRILVVDRASFPSDTVSTHFVHQAGLARLHAWGLLDRLRETGVPPLRHMLFANGELSVSGFADPIEGITEVYCPRRTVLDSLLVDAARAAGAEVVERFSVDDVLFADDGRAVGIRGRTTEGREREFRARFVVGADGANSTVAARVGADVYRAVPATGFVYYSYFSGLDWEYQNRTRDERQFASCVTHDDLMMVVVMRKRAAYQEFRADAEAGFQGVIDHVAPELGADLRGRGRREEPFRAIHYADNFYRRSHGPGWALVGDAGYHKDPLTGYGITDAFVHAELLADALHLGLSGAEPIDTAVAGYAQRRDSDSAGVFNLTVAMSELTLSPFLRAVLTAVGQSPGYLRKFFTMVGGGYPSEEFFAPPNLAALYDEVGTPPADRILPAIAGAH